MHAMQEIEKLAKTSRDLARANQGLEESLMHAVSDQARTAKRLLLVSGQLEYTEQQLFNLTKEVDDGQKSSELLRIERLKRETLQEHELQEVQASERTLQQRLHTIQNKYETLSKRHDNLKRQQQELELARESKEALAWLKETTDRLCSPPQGSLGHAIQQERSSHGSIAISIHQRSPSSSPPYPSSFIDPPLAAQNQLISLIKELATTNSTLRSELNEYRDLLQDTRNEMLALRSQVEDYEQGHAFENCCGVRVDDGDSLHTSQSAWSTLDVSLGRGLDAVSHIGTLGSIPGSPPPYMTAHKSSSRHHRHNFHLSGVRGNVFGELERLYSQGTQGSKARRHDHNHSSKKSKRKTHRGHLSSNTGHSENQAATVSTSTSTSETRRESNAAPTKLREQHGPDASSPTSHASRSRRSMYTDADLDMLDSGTESGDEDDSAGNSSDMADSVNGQEEPGFVARFAEQPGNADSTKAGSSTPRPSQHTSLQSRASLDETLAKNDDSANSNLSDSDQTRPTKNRASSVSLLSAELQRATLSDPKNGSPEGEQRQRSLQDEMHPFEQENPHSPNAGLNAVTEDQTLDPSSTSWSKPGRNRFPQHEKSSSDQGLTARQRRRLSEPLHHQASSTSLPMKKNRPSSIYSVKRPRLQVDSPSMQCIHSGHVASTSLEGAPELQRCKSAELVEQLIVERRNRVMEAWRVGVVAAAVTQQQAIHSVVAFSEHRKDTDNMSIRSKASRRRDKAPLTRGSNVAGLADGQDTKDGLEQAPGILSSKDSDNTIKDARESEEQARNSDNEPRAKHSVENSENSNAPDGQVVPQLTIDTTAAGLENTPTRLLQAEIRRGKKRHSMQSVRSVRSTLLRSPHVRSSLPARDRRFASEASTASEAFANRRYDHEHSPYQLLHTLSSDLLERLARSDTRELNRRLRRTFDIQALSQMSNSVIENVLTDVSNLNERFRWLEAQVADPIDELLVREPGVVSSGGETGAEIEGRDENDEASEDDEDLEPDWGFSVTEFFPLAHMMQEMLSEIGKLRMTINDLQRSYVQKVEQDLIKAEKDFMEDLSSGDESDYEDNVPFEPRSAQAADKSAQSKRVLSILERPRILGSASTGMSGFFNKVFGNSGQHSHGDPKASGAQKTTAPTTEAPRVQPTISKSKSGLVVAETSRVFADSAWISSPGKPVGVKTPAQSATTITTDGPRRSGTAAILVPGSRLSATTSLAAMATMSPARYNTIHVTETSTTAIAASSNRIRAIDISFSPDVLQRGAARSPPTASPPATSPQSIFSRSLPHNSSLGLMAADNDNITTAPPALSEQNLAPTSFQSRSTMSEDLKYPPLQSVTEPSESNPKSGDTSSQTPVQGQRSSALNKTPRSIDISARSATPAVSVVTRHDVFQDHWASSTPSSLSANVSTVPSRAQSERRATGDSVAMAGGAAAALMGSHKAGSSAASLSSNSVTSETMSTVASRLASKPALITRSALTVATPSTSTVSSPMSSASWFDTRRQSGGLGQDTAATSEVRTTFDEPGPATSGSGADADSGAKIGREQPTLRKLRTATSFHAGTTLGGPNDVITRSLGRTSGRESALAFLRGEVQASSLLGSLFQSQQPQTQAPAGSLSVQRPNNKSIYKGKGVASDSQADSATVKVNVEVLTSDDITDDHGAAERGSAGIEQPESQSSSSRPISQIAPPGANQLGYIAAPTASLSQKAAVTSTAITYVVATPDPHGQDEEVGGSRRKRQVFDRELIRASQRRILAGVPHQDKPFVPEARPRRARALSVDSAQSTEPLKANEIMDLWRVGAGVSRDIWRGLIKKVDGRDS
ncbi:hypothetical protein BGZ54_006475 [Gamsiella multidivaricata]|nr:hypothetical protein BGZ54_006475 [Gamsiella multidivaricata]